jgi:PAS domain S-box-containing protein
MGEDWKRHLIPALTPMKESTDQAVPLGLILTELLINANKYAYAGAAGPIEVALAEDRTHSPLPACRLRRRMQVFTRNSQLITPAKIPRITPLYGDKAQPFGTGLPMGADLRSFSLPWRVHLARPQPAGTSTMTADRDEFVRRQRALADFGEFALGCEDLQKVLEEGCRLVAKALRADLAKIMQIERGDTALVCAGLGWQPGIVGQTRISLHERSSEAYSIQRREPVITHDIASEERFSFPVFMQDHGVVSLVNVPIFLPGAVAFGLLEVDARQPRDFGEEDIEFLRTYCTVLGPVIDRLHKVSELERNNERYRLIVENLHDYAIILSDPQDFVTDWLPGAATVLGWSEEEMIGMPLATIFTPQDQLIGAPEQEIEGAKANGTSPDVRWHATKGGGRVFLDGQTIALRHADGTIRGFLKIGQDVTRRKRDDERRTILLAELQHRVRNVLAVVASVVKRSDAAGTTEEFRTRLSGRIAAMGRTQALLTQGAGVGVGLEDIVRDELLAQMADGSRIAVAGPAVLLAPKAVEVLTLAIHELATNAIKYGALHQPGGRVDVAWSVNPRDGQDWLELHWRESGYTVEPKPNRRKGFGTELITRRVPYELAGQAR